MSGVFHTTMSALEDSLTCELIATRVDARGPVPDEADLERIVAIARAHKFQQVVVRTGDERRLYRVAEVDERGRVAIRDMRLTEVIEGRTPIGAALKLLAEAPVYYVLVEDRIRKVLTRPDLNKLPVQVWIGTVIAHLEVLMAKAIMRLYPKDAWMRHLPPSRRELVEHHYQAMVERDYETEKIDNTSFADKIQLLLTAREVEAVFKQPLDPDDPLVEHLKDVRNQVFHGKALTNSRDVALLAQTMRLAERWLYELAAFNRERKRQTS